MALLWREHGARSWVLNEEQKQKLSGYTGPVPRPARLRGGLG
jgi:hypothetical protein